MKSPATRQHDFKSLKATGVQCFSALPALRLHGLGASVDDGPDVQLSLTTSLRRDALSARRFRRGRGDEFLEARIVAERIEHGIEPKQRGSERYARSKYALIWYRE